MSYRVTRLCRYVLPVHASYIYVFTAVMVSPYFISDANAVEWSINSSVHARYEYNDNLFLTTLPHDSVSNYLIQPDVKFSAEERNWKTMFDARVRSNHYSEPNLDSNDQYYLIDGSYRRERDTFSLKGNYDLNSTLDTESTDFGVSATRINRTTKSLSPSYMRMLTERLLVSLTFTATETTYDDLVTSGFVPYEADIGSASFAYNLTERDKLNTTIQYTDYISLSGLSEYQLLVVKGGLSRQFTENFKADFLLGISERDTINRSTSNINFFGTIVSLTQESDFNNRGYVLDTGFEYKADAGSFSGRLSRDEVTSSYGGVDEVDRLTLVYNRAISDRWSYVLDGRYEETRSDITSTSFKDRNLLKTKADINYTLDRGWKMTASWRHMQREFTTQNQSNVPDSDMIYIGMTYNYSELSTF